MYHELHAIQQRAAELKLAFPLIFLHDIDWPYGRRDLYYDPSTIPAEFRHRYAKKGIAPGRSELLDSGGFNLHLDNATHEGGPRNGVLTAIEDFRGDCGQETAFIHFDSLEDETVTIRDCDAMT